MFSVSVLASRNPFDAVTCQRLNLEPAALFPLSLSFLLSLSALRWPVLALNAVDTSLARKSPRFSSPRNQRGDSTGWGEGRGGEAAREKLRVRGGKRIGGGGESWHLAKRFPRSGKQHKDTYNCVTLIIALITHSITESGQYRFDILRSGRTMFNRFDRRMHRHCLQSLVIGSGKFYFPSPLPSLPLVPRFRVIALLVIVPIERK